MSPGLSVKRQSILYHALGKHVDEGLTKFDADFGDAEAEYRLRDVEALLRIIQDRTLQDERLVYWHHYYEARAALMLWNLDAAAEHLEAIGEPAEADRRRLEPRLKLLDGQLKVMTGQWAAGRDSLKMAVAAFRVTDEGALQADAYEYMAQAYLMQAQAVGSWAEPQPTRGARIGRWLARLSLLPVLAVMFLILRIWRAEMFIEPAVRFAADFTNWPVFRCHLYAYRALRRARRKANRADPEQGFRLDLMRAELLRSLTAYKDARKAYADLDEAWAGSGSAYQKALIDHGRARTLVEIASSTTTLDKGDDPSVLLERARATYEQYNDERALAHVDLLRGDLALADGRVKDALDLWAESIAATDAKQEPVGLADGLGRCYALLDSEPAADVAQRLREILGGVTTKAFSARLPTRLFRMLRWAVWLVPLVVVLAGVLLLRSWLGLNERTEYRELTMLVFSWWGLLGAGLLLVVVMVANSILGLLGLLATLFIPATHLDTFVIDERQIRRVDSTDMEAEAIAWDDVAVYLRVERAVWVRPVPPLSFDYLRALEGQRISLPATTRWFGYLRDEIEAHTAEAPQVCSLKAYGGLVIFCLGLAFPVTFLILDLACSPALLVDALAIVAMTLMLVSFISVVYATHRWIAHYVQVYDQTLESRRFAIVVGLLGILLLLAGFIFDNALYPLHTLPMVWGISVLFNWVGALDIGPWLRDRSGVRRIGQIAVLLCGLVLLWLQVTPALLHLAAFTYGGAVQKLNPGDPGEAAERGLLFERIEMVSHWILTLDPTFHVAYGFLGVAEHGQGNYEEAIEAYSSYIELTGDSDLYDCRALAYLELGKDEQARMDFEAYKDKVSCGSKESHYCDRYFPGTRERFFNHP